MVRISTLPVCVLLLVGALCSPSDYISQPVEKFKINLDLPPRQRWSHVDKSFCYHLKNFEPTFKQFRLIRTEAKYVEVKEAILRLLNDPSYEEMREEILGISETCEIDVGYLAIYNLMYELGQTMACTAVIYSDGKTAYLANNLDYMFFDFFLNVIMHAEFYKEGKLVLEGLQLFGFIGLTTNKSPYLMSTLNARKWPGSTLDVLLAAINDKSLHFTVYESRKRMLSSKTLDEYERTLAGYTHAVPAYFSVVEINGNKGSMIVRGWDRIDYKEVLGENPSDNWFYMQTNSDRDHICPRQEGGVQKMQTMSPTDPNLTSELISSVLSQSPNFDFRLDLHDNIIIRTIATTWIDDITKNMVVVKWVKKDITLADL